MTYHLPPIESWTDWTRTYNDISLWRPVVAALCASEGIRFQRIERPRSNTNAVFILDCRLVVKIYSPFWSEYDIEPKLIEVLTAEGTVPVPKIIASGRYQDRATWPYLVIEHRTGATLESLRPELSHEELMFIATQVGALTKALHETEIDKLEGSDAGETWDELVDRRRREVLPELVDRGLTTSDVTKTLAGILDDVIDDSGSRPRVIVHGDLESDHVLLSRTDGQWRVSAIIDFGDAWVGARDYEWMPLWLGLFDRNIDEMRAFLKSYDPTLLADQALPRRIIAWTLLHDFGTDAISELLQRINTPTPIKTFDELSNIVWPGLTDITQT
ncbi:MAG: aminoglycoside phosphotransferase family protein [Dehalococcoidia bacterium]|nr:aminoglycoside phosphotransferase family protein [Dehalococcoidia bacterium]